MDSPQSLWIGNWIVWPLTESKEGIMDAGERGGRGERLSSKRRALEVKIVGLVVRKAMSGANKSDLSFALFP